MKKYQLENPNNARVTIDYNNSQEPIKFEYVAHDSLFKIVFGFIKDILIMLLIPLFLMYISFLSSIGYVNSGTYLPYLSVFVVFSLFLSFSYSLILMNNKSFIKKLPYLQTRFTFRRYYYVKLKPEDMKDNTFEIPLFHNIVLIYLAEGEFSKYLEKVEIIEHPFLDIVKKGVIFKPRFKKSDRLLIRPNQYLWKCIFTFSKKPETGSLECKFK